jgi:hypothetical protein
MMEGKEKCCLGHASMFGIPGGPSQIIVFGNPFNRPVPYRHTAATDGATTTRGHKAQHTF